MEPERRRSGAVFSSRQCPPASGGLEHSCQLPFGFLWTPFAGIVLPASSSSSSAADPDVVANTTTQDSSGDPDVAVVVNHGTSGDDDDDDSLPPVLCTTCLAYMNLYCDTRQGGKIWICPFCQCENGMPTRGGGGGWYSF